MGAHDPTSSSGPDGPPVGAFPRRRLWLHVLLFLLTVVTSTFCGGLYYGWLESPSLLARLSDPRLVSEGLKFSLPLLTILLVHESGHVLAARRHRLPATLPYFIPMPIPFPYSPGTMGAVIRVRAPIRSRRALLAVGAAGPLAGFVTLLPFLVLGLGLSRVQEVATTATGLIYFGEPLIFRFFARVVFFPHLGATEDILLHPTAWAAWFGLLVTALNLLPFSQLDGGHVAYALLGRWHRHAVWGLYAALLGLGLLWPGWWLWAVIILILGLRHPPALDELRPLDSRRRWIGLAALAVLVLSFTPVPVWVAP